MLIKAQNVHMCILLYITVTYYVADLSSRQGECPTTNKTATVLTKSKSGHEFRRGATPRRTDWLTDRPTVSCKVTVNVCGLWRSAVLR